MKQKTDPAAAKTARTTDNPAVVHERLVRLVAPRKTPKTIKVKWGVFECGNPDWCVAWGEGCPKSDARLVCNAVSELAEDLVARGYDRTTLRFSISLTNSLEHPTEEAK